MQIPVIVDISKLVQTKQRLHEQVLWVAEKFFQLFPAPKIILAILPPAFAVFAGHKRTLGGQQRLLHPIDDAV